MYKNEQLLVNDITNLISIGSNNIPSDFKRKNQIMLTEVNLGYGIADVVLTECEEIKEMRTDYLSPIDIRVLSIINTSSGTTIDKICNITKCRKRKVKYSINKLADLNYIIGRNKLFTPGRTYRMTVKSVIAIEAKLINWKRALKQAYRYKWFSDRSFVCLPHSNVQPAIKNIDSFRETNVGLIEISPDEGMTILHAPKPHNPISEDMSILLNESILSEINGSEGMLPKC